MTTTTKPSIKVQVALAALQSKIAASSTTS